MARHYIYSLSSRRLHPYAGSKAVNIHFLVRQGRAVPNSWVIIWTACEDHKKDSHVTLMTLRKELLKRIDPNKFYAVRSSASVEDSGDFSCAGLFKSFLQVQGIENILNSVVNVWASLESPEFKAYWNCIMSEGKVPRMAVIIQEMVQAQFSGVVFTKNPVTSLSDTIIEAGAGLGESQIQERRDPDRWVSKWGKWTQKPEESEMSESLARDIVEQATSIARKYKRPADLEWAWDGEKLYFLQVRPITRLDIPVYSNRIAREMLPGIIKPLVWSVNTRLINPTWVNILTRLTGNPSWDPDSLTGYFYNRAYFNMGIFARVFERLGLPGEALELLFGLEKDGPEKPHMHPGFGIIPRLPRLFVFALSFIGIHHRLQRLVKNKKVAYDNLIASMKADLKPEDWLQKASLIFDETQEVAYYNIIIPLLAMMHYQLLAALLKQYGYDVRMLELEGSREAASKYNPQYTLQALHACYFENVVSDPDGAYPLSDEQEARLKQDIDKFLEVFGHFSDSGNDCSSVPWRETPELIRRMIARPQQAVKNGHPSLRFKDLKIPWMQRIMTGIIYRRTSRFAVSREEISSLYTFGYGQFRTCFINIAEQLVAGGVIDDREDIYYLHWDELIKLFENQQSAPQQDLVSSRQRAMALYRSAVLPEMILGSEQPPVMVYVQDSLRGIPTSLGAYSGPARVIQGINEFEKVQDGDVLIIPFSDVGWTPLFAKAGAVISESGGMLSHSSIVAREYRIPAVVSVAGACRIEDGVQVAVNGYTGDVVLL
ncbi:PEP/pyruvate-binding domain-containing protein [Acidaminobacter hydrogenoformans]|uniref:Pyruvate phosphate dikinase, PEP/pyruvate binding domain n=1 Tax=Acidaminobacter hydrogenoformans DSM 2784 TaxID=1120920 RepID=A0A1G5RVF5_9FIRM|nr:PEP/pyruvate-binding domain-containing protein [Acidaminobacter hydrogenoformans]SCZ78094.1 Pyruvate phosphate dikinase, PEP/pyruvate binding domain [Acidaminobacter hydrogenoformans DSM 2784]